MDRLLELVAAANKYKTNESPLEREKAFRKVVELISAGDEEFLKMVKRLLSGNGDKRDVKPERDGKEKFW